MQAYRAALLNGAEQLSPEHQEVITGTSQALDRLGLALPLNRRWPIRVDLAAYARDNGPGVDSTLNKYIAERISKRWDEGTLKPWVLKSWVQQWPCFVMLDGLDEVTEPTIRKELIKRISEYASDVDADSSDVFIVLTTRPMGYVENIAPNQFERVDLDDLEPAAAIAYGALTTRVRLRNDHDRIDRIIKTLEQSAQDDGLKNLLRTPLQLTFRTSRRRYGPPLREGCFGQV